MLKGVDLLQFHVSPLIRTENDIIMKTILAEKTVLPGYSPLSYDYLVRTLLRVSNGVFHSVEVISAEEDVSFI